MKELKPYQLHSLNQYRHLNRNVVKGSYVFAGSSLMEYFPVNEIMQKYHLDTIVYNRGIAGMISEQLLDHIDDLILNLEPSRLYINIGTNDISANLEEELFINYEQIIHLVKSSLPECRIYIMAFYPCNERDDFAMDENQHAKFFTYRTSQKIQSVNRRLETLAHKNDCRYIDVNDGLYDETGLLKKELSVDGIHMYPEGYEIVMRNLLKHLD